MDILIERNFPQHCFSYSTHCVLFIVKLHRNRKYFWKTQFNESKYVFFLVSEWKNYLSCGKKMFVTCTTQIENEIEFLNSGYKIFPKFV